MSSNEFIWEPLPSLPSKPDLFGWPGGDSDSEDPNEATGISKSIVNSYKNTKDPSGNASLTGVSSASDGGDNSQPTNSSGIGKPSGSGGSGSQTMEGGTRGTGAAGGSGHTFSRKTVRRPVTCQQCTDTVWGLGSSAVQCDVCGLLVHDKCAPLAVALCTTISPIVVARPLAHCWTEPCHLKRKFCNVCRRKMDDGRGVKCEVCGYHVHEDCVDYAVSDCKEGAAYCPNFSVDTFKQQHLWREGNLPSSSKCTVCRKSCHSSECLTGFRCEWCSMKVHSACLRLTSMDCDIGALRSIVLPPSAVCLPRTKISMESIVGVSRPSHVRNVSEEWSDEESKEESFIEKKNPKDHSEKELSDDYAKVFDGHAGLKRRAFRCFNFSKSMTAYTAIECSLRSFHIFGRPEEYCLFEINDRDGSEFPLDDKGIFRNQLKFDHRRPLIVLRYKLQDDNNNIGKLKIYPGDLVYCANVSSKYKEIPINKETTAKELLIMAMRRFHCEPLPAEGGLDPDQFCLAEICLDRGASERSLEPEERPWALIETLRRMGSARALRLSRLCVRAHADPHGPGVSLFVGNLVENLNQSLYERMLLDKLGHHNKWDAIEVIYYENGCLVLSYSSGARAEASYDILKDSEVRDRRISVAVLPRILAPLVPAGVTPLLVLVNPKSGGCQGSLLLSAFRRALNPHQVFNLELGGPLPGLYCFRQLAAYRILVCGGDGTVGWTLSCLDSTCQDALCSSPPIAVLPLGTGNDLARVLNWGGGYSSADDPLSVLHDVVDAEEVKLDRWTLVVKSDDPDKDEAKLALQLETNTLNTNEDSSLLIIMNNYFGIGLDADLALDFHNARSENPDKFNSRIHNKTVYLKMGLRKMVYRSCCKELHRQIIVEADGRPVELPPCEGLIVLNILSWGGGANPWGSSSGADLDDGAGARGGAVKPTHHDGLLEVLGVSGMVHMGQIYSGIRSGIKICQAGHLKITLKNDLPVQVDGEPFLQSPGTITVLKSALRAIMLRKSKRSRHRHPDSANHGVAESMTVNNSSHHSQGSHD